MKIKLNTEGNVVIFAVIGVALIAAVIGFALSRTSGMPKETTIVESTASGMKKPAASPTKTVPGSETLYNSHYYCASDTTNRCEMCWTDEFNKETCCYKTTEQIAKGDERCGPNDTAFPPSQKSAVGR